MSLDIQSIQWLRKLSPQDWPDLSQLGSRLYGALVSIQNGVSNIESQTNSNAAGTAQSPPPIQGVNVDGRNGIFHISIKHEAAFQRGIQYHAEYADNPQFANPFPIAMGTSREWRGALGAGTLHFRVAASYGISPPTNWIYHGGAIPKPVDGGGLPGPPLPTLSQGSGTGAPGQGLQGPGTQPVRQPGVGSSGPRAPNPYTNFVTMKPIILRGGGVSGSGGGGGGGGGGTGITQLTGDVTAGPGAGSQAASVVKVNGASVPASQPVLASNSSSQLIGATTTGSGSIVVLAGGPTFTTQPTLPGENNNAAQTPVNASISGSVVFSQPQQGASWKKSIAYCIAANGTAAYSFPVPFVNLPAILTTNQLSSSLITSLSTSAVTITGSTSTGFLIMEGY